MTNVEYVGHEISHETKNSPDSCQEACVSTPKCAGFTWKKDNSCSLKDNILEKYDVANVISGPPSCGKLINVIGDSIVQCLNNASVRKIFLFCFTHFSGQCALSPSATYSGKPAKLSENGWGYCSTDDVQEPGNLIN